jgi:hypothetical protein
MAFKFYHSLSKGKKNVFWAFLTLIAMFVFIIGDPLTGRVGAGGSSGGCSSRAGKWFGTGTYVADVEGEKLDEYDIHMQGRKWLALFMFLQLVEERGVEGALNSLKITDPQETGMIRYLWLVRGHPLDDLLQNWGFFSQQEIPRLEQQGMPNARQVAAAIQQKLQQELQSNKDRLRNLELPADGFPYQLSIYMRRTLGNNGENLKPDMFLERQFWLHRANELGMVVATDRLKDDLAKFGRSLVSENEIRKFTRDPRVANAGFKDLDAILNFMSEETRIMMAKGLLYNRAAGRLVQPTPFEIWQSYVKVMTELDTVVVPFSSENTDVRTRLDRQQPTPAEAQELFQKYKTELPDPSKPTPGFRIPEKFQAEFLLGDVSENSVGGKYYQRLYEAKVLGDPYGKFREHVAIYNSYLDRREREYKHVVPFVIVPVGPQGKATLLEVRHQWSRLNEPTAVAALTGQFLAQAGPGLPTLGMNALAQVTTKPATTDAKRQVLQLLGSFGGGLPGLLALTTTAGESVEYTSFAQVYDELRKEYLEQQRAELCHGDLTKLQADLQKYSPEYRKAYDKWRKAKNKGTLVPPVFQGTTVKEYLDKFARERGFTYARMTQPYPFHAVFQAPVEVTTPDENLAKMSNKTTLTLLRPIFQDPQFMMVQNMLAREEFQRNPDFDPMILMMDYFLLQRTLQGQSTQVERQVYEPILPLDLLRMFGNAQPSKQILYWKTEQQPERTPQTLDDVKDAVEAAWLAEQMRPKLEQRAKTLMADITAMRSQGKPDADRLLKDYPGMKDHVLLKRFQSFPLGTEEVLMPAPLPTRRTQQAETQASFWQRLRQQAAPDGVLEYPPEDFIEQVMTSLKQPGDMVIIPNKPKKVYYLIYLRDRKEPRLPEANLTPEKMKEVAAQKALGDWREFTLKYHSIRFVGGFQDLQSQRGLSLRDFAFMEKAKTYQEEWKEFIRKRSKYNAEMGDRVSKDLEAMLSDLQRGR